MALRKTEEFLNLFWDLAECEDSKRIDAVEGIFNSLQSNDDDLEKLDLQYTVERLVRGLTSERKSARLGFFAALTLAVKTFDEISVENVLQLGDKHFKATENNEKRNCVIAQALLYAAVIRSKMQLTTDQVELIATKLIDTGTKKFYLEVFISNILTNFLENIGVSQFSKIVFPVFKEILSCGWENATPFHVWLLFFTSRLFPTVINKAYLKEHWGQKVLMVKETCHQFAQIMMKSTSAHPKIHPVCLELVSAAQNSEIFDYFWEIVVDETLIPCGQEKGYLSFELVKYILPKLESIEDVKSILKANFIRQFIQNLSHEELPLHCAAKKLADFLVTFVSTCEDTSIQSVIVQRLLTKPGTILFDKITKTRTIHALISELKFEALDDLTTFLMKFVSGSSTDGVINSVDADNRVAAVKQLEFMFKHKVLVKNWEWKRKVIRFFVENAFFDMKSDDQDETIAKPINSELHGCLSSCLLRVYSQVTTQTFNYWKPNIRDLFATYYESIELCDNLLKDSARASPVLPFDDNVMKHWKRLWKVVKQLRKQNETLDAKTISMESCIFEILYLQMMLHLLVNPDEIIPFVEEVEVCYEKAMEREPEDEDEPNWTQVLTDIILSFVSKAEQKTFHCMVESVTHLLAPRMTVKTVQQILNVISPQADEEDILVDEDEEEMEESGDENSDADEKEASSEDSLSSEDEDLDDGESKSFDNALQVALHYDSEESDIDLDEVDQAELDRKDEIYAELLRLKKKPNFQTECNLRNFKLRCLNLLNVIVDVHPTIPVICSMIVPVLEVIVEFAYKNQESRVYHVRAKTLLRRLINQKEFEEPIEPNEVPDFLGIWHQIVGMAEKISNLLITRDLADAIGLLTRCMKKWSSNDLQVMSGLVAPYKTLMHRYFVEKTSHIHLSFISSFLDKNLNLSGEFLIDIIDYTAMEDVRLYKKTQSLGLATTIMNHAQVLKEWDLKKWNLVYSKLDNCVKMAIDTMGEEMKPTFASNLFSVYWSFYQQYKKAVGKPFEIISEDIIKPILHKLPKTAKRFIRNLNRERKNLANEITVSSPDKKSKKRKREKKIETDIEVQEILDEVPQQIEPESCEKKKKSPKKRRKNSLKLTKLEPMEVTEATPEINSESVVDEETETIEISELDNLQNGFEEDCQITLQNGLDEVPELVIDESDDLSSCQIITPEVRDTPENGRRKKRKLDKQVHSQDDVICSPAAVKHESVSLKKQRGLSRLKSGLTVLKEEVGVSPEVDDPYTFKSDTETTPVKTRRPSTRNSAKKTMMNGLNASPVVVIKDILGTSENGVMEFRRSTRVRNNSETSSVDQSQSFRRSSRLQNKKLK